MSRTHFRGVAMGEKRLSVTQFKKTLGEKSESDSVFLSNDPLVLSKGFSCSVEKAPEADQSKQQLLFNISTGGVDRDNDTISPKGFVNLASFHKTGVILWAHDSSLPPIGKPIKAWRDGDSVKAIAEFSPADMDHPLGRGFGATVYRMYTAGFMRSVSIGFAPIKWKRAEDREGLGFDFQKQELLEFSAVPIPANRDATVQLTREGHDMRGIYRWAQKCLDGGATLVVPREYIEDTYKELKEFYREDKTISIPEAAVETRSEVVVEFAILEDKLSKLTTLVESLAENSASEKVVESKEIEFDQLEKEETNKIESESEENLEQKSQPESESEENLEQKSQPESEKDFDVNEVKEIVKDVLRVTIKEQLEAKLKERTGRL